MSHFVQQMEMEVLTIKNHRLQWTKIRQISNFAL